ncbi:UNVERIFIED_CONTAM: hypothetical protein FKN15_013729 [Acipenser sinensis]
MVIFHSHVLYRSFQNHNKGTDCFATSPDIPLVTPPSVASAIAFPPIRVCHIAYHIKAMTSGIVTLLPFWMADF